jgi:predicted AAA+ superfamily ATPase
MTDIETIKRAIVDKEEDLKGKMKSEKIIERELKIDRISTDAATIITGVRRCGKSVLAFLLTLNKQAAYVNFEDERLQVEARNLNLILEAIASLKGEVEFIVFDEIQYINGWERFVSRLLPTRKIIITGSNTRLLSKEFATFLSGRHIDYELFPFSFREYLKFNNFTPNVYLTRDISKTRELLKEYIKTGGFPLTFKLGRNFLVENYKDIVERDVIQRYKVKYEKVLKELAKYYISTVAREISFNKLKNILNVKSVQTIKNYSEFLSNSYLIFFLEKYSPKLKLQMISPKKVYCIDNGFVETMSFKASEDFGRLMENLVAVELMRRKSYWFKNQEIYYWKDYQQNEVDFVVREGEKIKQLIQVTYASNKNEIETREIKGLLKASELLKCENLLVVTWDYEDEITVENKKIVFKPLWKWLLIQI